MMFDREPVHELDGLDLDRLDIECTQYQPAPELLSQRRDAGAGRPRRSPAACSRATAW